MTKQKDKIKLSSLQKNKKNPRYITAEKLEKLKASIESFEQMLEARPIVTDEDGVILGGNMRYEALKALGYKEIPAAWVKTLTGLTDEQKSEFLIKDNVGFGAWDWDTLANEWESELLNEWGLDTFDISSDINLDNFFEDADDTEKAGSFKIILEYREEDYNEIQEAFKQHTGSKEEIIYKLLTK